MTNLDDSIDLKWNAIEHSFLNSREDIASLLIDYIKIHRLTFEY